MSTDEELALDAEQRLSTRCACGHLWKDHDEDGCSATVMEQGCMCGSCYEACGCTVGVDLA